MKLGFRHKAGRRSLDVLKDGKIAFGVDMLDEELTAANLADSLRMLADKLDGKKTRWEKAAD